MSKKIVRDKNYFCRRWFSVIAASCLALSAVQAAQAGPERREAFQNFRDNNPELARNEARKMFNQQFRAGRGDNDAAAIRQSLRNEAGLTRGQLNRAERQLNLNLNLQTPKISNHSIQTFDNSTVRLNTGIDLNLASSDRNITLGQKLFDNVGSIQITVGGETRTVQAGSQVSAAEYVAVKQVLAGGAQQISVDGAGRANGGQFDLSHLTTPGDRMRASNFVLPENVTAYGDFSRASEIRLTGDLDNYGSIYTIASSKKLNSGTIHADDITNYATGLISTQAPAELGLNANARRVNLGLDASGDLVNMGTITASGNLSLSAGSGNITNSGRIESSRGDVSFNGSSSNVLNINNDGGTVLAERGAVSIRNASYADTSNTYVKGGDFLSREFNTNAGQGITYVDVNQLTGKINQTGAAAHVQASTDVLSIGNICLTGDPTYRNTAGNIQILGDITVAEALTIVARDNIVVSSGVDLFAGNAVEGFNITLIAGAEITGAVGGADSGVLPPFPASTTLLTLSGNGSMNGGSISFGSNTTINTRSTAGVNTNGGNVLLAAYDGATVGSGIIAMSNTSVQTGGRGAGTNGSVTIIAGAENATAISLGTINTTGSIGGGGDVSVTTAQPVSSGGDIEYDATGALVSAAGIISSSTLTPTASLAVRTIAASGNVSLQAGNVIQTEPLSSIISPSGQVGLRTTDGDMTINGSIIGNNVILIGGKNITVNAPVTPFAAAGLIVVDAANAFNVNNSLSATASIFVTAGSILLAGSGNIVSTAGNVVLESTGNIIGGANNIVSAANGNISLSSASGNIGANAGLKFRIDGATLDATAFSGSIYIAESGVLDITSLTAANRADVIAGDTLSNSGLVSADVLNLQSTGDAYIMNADIAAGTSASIKANTDLIGTAPARLSAPQIYLSAESADIGGGGLFLPFLVDADNIVINALVGSALIIDNNSLNFGGGSTFVGTNLIASANSYMSTSSVITGASVGLSSLNGSVNIGAAINASGLIQLSSKTSLNNSNIFGELNAPTVGFVSTGGDVGSLAAPINTSAARVTAVSTTGSAYINATNPDVVVLAGSTQGEFVANAAGSVDVVSSIDGDAGLVRITAPAGITTSTGTITGGTVRLTTNGDIGEGVNDTVFLDAQEVFLNAGDGIWVTNTSVTPVTLRQAGSTETIFFDAVNANLISPVNFTQNDITLRTGDTFLLAGNFTNNGSVTLRSWNILTNDQVLGLIQTNALGLESNLGVGADAVTPFVLPAGTANIVRGSSQFGSVFINSLSLNPIALTDTDVDHNIVFRAAGSVNIIGNLRSFDGDIDIFNSSGAMTIEEGVTIRAYDRIRLINSGTNKKQSKIIFKADVTLETEAKIGGLGDILIQLGTPVTKVVTKVPKNVEIEETGGFVDILGKSLTAVGPLNTIKAIGADATISNSLNKKNLTLGGGVNIIADPPVAPGTPTFIFVGGTTRGATVSTAMSPYAVSPANSLKPLSPSAPYTMPATIHSGSVMNALQASYDANFNNRGDALVRQSDWKTPSLERGFKNEASSENGTTSANDD